MMQSRKLFAVILMSLFLGYFSSQDGSQGGSEKMPLFVSPDNNGDDCKLVRPCNCSTLSSYAERVDSGFSLSNTELIFFPGLHRLDRDLVIDSFFGVTMTTSNDSIAVIECDYEVGFTFTNVTNLIISRLVFTRCSKQLPNGTTGIDKYLPDINAGLYFNVVTNLNMSYTTVQNSTGYGVVMVQIIGSSFITNCHFQFNEGADHTFSSGGNALIAYNKCSTSNYTPKLNIDCVIFSDGVSRTVSASGLIILLMDHTCIDIYIAHTVLHNNKAGKYHAHNISWHKKTKIMGGNMAVVNLQQSNANIVMSDCNFTEGQAYLGGGLYMYIDSTKKDDGVAKWMAIDNCHFVNNTAYNGGGVYIRQAEHCKRAHISISQSQFVKNKIKGTGGAAILVEFPDRSNDYYTSVVNITNCKIMKNTGSRHPKKDPHISFSLVSAALSSNSVFNLLIENTVIENNEVTGIFGTNSQFIFKGEVCISNNSNTNGIGGGLFLSDYTTMLLHSDTTVTIAHNHASYNGGGIYVEDHDFLVGIPCFFEIDFRNMGKKVTQANLSKIIETIHVIVVNNSAGNAGSQLYGGQIDTCDLGDMSDLGDMKTTDIVEQLFTFHPDNDLSRISSDPQNVYFCDEKHHPSKQNTSVTVYSGEKFNISMVVTGQRNGTIPGIVHFIHHKDNDFKNTTINAIAQLAKGCANYSLHVTALTHPTEIRSIQLVIQAVSSSSSFVKSSSLYINFLPTPLGFRSSETEDAWVYTCIQQPPIEKFGFECKIEKNSSYIIRRPPYWLGYVPAENSSRETFSKFVLYSYCPQGYCKSNNVSIYTDSEHFHNDDQCYFSRTGILCGQCQRNLSLSMGSTTCISCTHFSVGKTIGLSLFYAVSMVTIVCVLLILNITVTQGTMSGFLFYINSLYIFWPLLAPRGRIDVYFYYCVAVANFVFNPNSCFYDGMDLVGNLWVKYATVSFLWVITGVVVVLCRNSQRASNFVGSRTVPVLATVVLLAHTKLNINIIKSVTPSRLEYFTPDGNTTELKYVMHYDGNVSYLSKEHLPLLVVSTVFICFSLCFAFLLLCVQPLQRYSHLKLLRWVNRLKPFLDAYSCPHIIQPHCRFWNGFLLVQRSIMYYTYTGSIGKNPQETLSVILTVCVMVLFVAWLLGGVYNQRRLQFLNFSYIINLGALSLILKDLKLNEEGDGNTIYRTAVSTLSISIAFITFLGTIVYHFFLQLYGLRFSLRIKEHMRVCKNKVFTLFRQKRGYQSLDDYAAVSDERPSI